jgi:anti-anti-sigma factor
VTSAQREIQAMDNPIAMQITGLTPDIGLVVLTGRLDIAGAHTIDLQFSAVSGAYRNLIIDMAGVSFLASIGIRTLLLGAKTVQRRGGKFLIVAPRPDVAEVLTVTGVDELMPIVPSLADARAAIGG